MRSRASFGSIAVSAWLLAFVAGVGGSSLSFAADGDPLVPLAARIRAQDELASRGQFDQLLKDAQTAARDGSAASLYLLGRAFGNVALVRRQEGKTKEFQDNLDRARSAFDEAQSAEVMLYPPALLGLARCDRQSGNPEAAVKNLEQALKLAPDFSAAPV